MWRIAKFVLFNSFLPALDIATDIKAFLFYLLVADHPKWAALTLVWVFAPLALQFGKFCHHLVTRKEAGWIKLLIHFPLILPLLNLYLAWKLYKLRFGMSDFDPKKWAEVKLRKQIHQR